MLFRSVSEVATVVKNVTPIGSVIGCLKDPGWGSCTIAAADVALTFCSVASDGACAPAKAALLGRLARDGRAADAAGDLATACRNSFTANTPVTLADGSKKPIKDVKMGDEVVATDPQTGETKPEPVVALIRHSGVHAMVAVTLADRTVLNTTDGHPVWDATQGTFVVAKDLHVGDEVETTSGALLTITALTTYSTKLIAYNLQIDQIHTYYAGTTPVLVHNSCADLDALSRAGSAPDRNGFTAAGRAAQKHGNRPGSFGLPTTRTAAGYNQYGQQMLDDLLTAPNTAVRSYVSKSYGQVTEYLGPTYGARFDAAGNLIGFL